MASFHRLITTVAVLLCGSSLTLLPAADEPPQVRALAGMIKPGATGGNDQEFQRKYFNIIYRLRDTWLDIGLRPAEQIERACALNKVTATRQMLLRGALVEAYDEVDALGLFDPDEIGKLAAYVKAGGAVPKVTKGPDAGKALSLTPYLKGAENKKFARDLANWRVSVEGEVVSPDAAAAHERIAQNRKQMMDQAMAQESVPREEKKEFEAEYKAALAKSNNEKAGKGAISIRGQVMELANRGNNETVRIEATISNSSDFPVGAKLEHMFIGRSPKKKKLVNLGYKSVDLKILPKEWHELNERSMSLNAARTRAGVVDSLDKPALSPAPRYLGWIIRVTDEEGTTLAFKTSGLGELDTMASTGQGLGSLVMQGGK